MRQADHTATWVPHGDLKAVKRAPVSKVQSKALMPGDAVRFSCSFGHGTMRVKGLLAICLDCTSTDG